eukprot:CAMPEP_0168315982 /NCGR_PEP_ID=MMETSP0210-20121227/13700_1 /TAXON_ID=40633 /ORGANISM="Condylostoma magnum, Strain COL2" /LENGTH=31 /DNA_ID= /DNA_START= /DNA_END= /DNA_ORIENTATION=
MMDIEKKVKDTEEECLNGQMVVNMMVNLEMI